MAKRRRQREERPSKLDRPVERSYSGFLSSPHPLLAVLALFLVVAGARWWLIGGYGVDVPWLDQWDAEAQGLYRPWHSGTLRILSWFGPHNEHRIFFTRVLAFGLVWLNRQWDPRLQMVVNAGLYAIVVAALFLFLRRGRSPGFQVFSWVLLAALGSAPYGSTNTLLGFQSQFYFLAGFSLLAIASLGSSRPGSLWWVAGVVGGFAALVSMASGYAAAVAVLGVLLVSAFRAGEDFRREFARHWLSALAAGAIVAAGLWLRYSPPGHEALAAKSAGDFLRFLLACLSWPGKPMVVVALLSWTPFAAFLVNYLRRRTPDDPAERFILGTGFWVLLQAAAVSMYRANSGEGLESRYTDILAFGLLANAVCAIWLLGGDGKLRRIAPVLAAVWFAVNGIGLYSASFDGSAFSWKRDMEIRRAATAGFLATGDQRYLDSAPPYGDAKHLAALLVDPALRPILPVGIRTPLPLLPRNGSPAPQLQTGLSTPDVSRVTADVWTMPGLFSRFAMIPPSTRFEYAIQTKGAAPFLLLYRVGNPDDAAVADSRGAQRWMFPLPSGRDVQGRHSFVYCPAGECVWKGASGPSGLAVMEPKEIGFLSIAALFAALWGHWVMAAGGIGFLAVVLASVARARSAQTSALTA